MKKLYLGLFLLTCLFIPKELLADRESDSLALVALYNNLDGDNWADTTGWLNKWVYLEDWYGVTTSAPETGLVTKLQLSDNNLSGTIPSAIGDFGSIVRIDLGDNSLSGSIPSDIGDLSTLERLELDENSLSGSIPSTIGNLTSLEWLNLGNNSLSGSIPSEIGNLSNMERLYLNNNEISGALPSEIYDLTSISTLNLSFNDIEDQLSSDIDNLTNLSSLIISGNNFYGSLPTEISNISGFGNFKANDNNFSSSIPSSWGSITYLWNLELSNNSITGNIPSSFQNLNFLQVLDLSNNSMSGSLPDFLSEIGSLENIYLNNNNFSNSIPSDFADISLLNTLNLSHNSLTGSVPSEFAGSNLYYLYLNNNQLSGTLPSVLANMSNLKTLDVSYNDFTGSILSGFGNSSNLSDLHLNNNNLSGSIPSELGNSSVLVKLYLDNNSLSGSIPTELGNMSSLRLFSVSNNSLTGSFPASLSNINTQTIDLSNNDLSGTLPDEAGDFTFLSSINLSNNDFSGDVPIDITGNSRLTYCYLQHNDFTGIPDMSGMSRLKGLNVANNKLQFDDLELNVGGFSEFFTYSPQADIGTESTQSVLEGETVQLSFSVAGDNNEYQWTKNGSDISGANTDTYTINSYDETHDGIYVLEITNTEATELTLYSADTELMLALESPTLVAPADAQIAVSLTPELEWNSVTNADNYEVQLSDDNTFPSTIFTEETTSLTSNVTAGLLSNSTTYYWRVKASNSEDESEWSEIRSFTTVLDIPDLTSPLDNSVDITATPLMQWSSVDNATSYGLEIAENELFENLIIDRKNAQSIAATSFTPETNDLEKGVEYFWRGRAENSSETSDWSEIWSFITQLATPDLSLPADNSINQEFNPDFEWNAVDNANIYEFRITADAELSSFLYTESNITVASYTLNAITLSPYTEYYWQIRAKNDISTGEWSDPFSFTTLPPLPAAPDLDSPTDLSVDLAFELNFEWNQVDYAETYDIQLSTENNFSVISYDYNVSSLNKTISNLSEITTYYWRVRAVNARGNGDWSDVWSFTTLPPVPDAPVLSSPDDMADEQILTPDLEWNTVNYADSYDVQLSEEDDFSSKIVDDNINNTLITVNGLSSLTTYYWRVRAVNANDAGEWSDVRSFTTMEAVVDPPALSSPDDMAVDQDFSLDLVWNAAENADSYDVQLSTEQDFSSTIIDDNLTTTSKSVSGLSENTTYYWRVRGRNSGGPGEWSDVWSFTTLIEPPVLASPADDAINVEFSPTLSWNASSGASTYEIEISDDSGFSTITETNDGLPSISYVLTATLSAYTTYYWRVKAKNGSQESEWSEVWSFITKLTAPALATPEDEAINQTLNPDFDWSSVTGATEYDFRLSTDETFATSDYTETVSTNALSLTLYDLSFNTEYFWQIKAKDGSNESNWSETYSFNTLLQSPQLYEPADGSVDVILNTQFTWEDIGHATDYDLEISLENNFDEVIVSQTSIMGTSFDLPEDNLEGSTEYFWRVKSKNGPKFSEWSDYSNFTTEDVEILIDIVTGWNLISSNLVPDNKDISVVFSNISDDIVIVKNDKAQIHIPEYSINTIGDWVVTDAYKVYASDNTTLTVNGSKVKPEEVTINLSEGLNYLPYLRDSAMDIETALQSIETDIVIVKDINGNIYIPSFGINTIGDMETGKAYFIYMNAPSEFSYPANE